MEHHGDRKPPLRPFPLDADCSALQIHNIDHNQSALTEWVEGAISEARKLIIDPGYDPRSAGATLKVLSDCVAPMFEAMTCHDRSCCAGGPAQALPIFMGQYSIALLRIAALEAELEQLRVAALTVNRPGAGLASGVGSASPPASGSSSVDVCALHWCAQTNGTCGRAVGGTSRFCCAHCQRGLAHQDGCDRLWATRRDAVHASPWEVGDAR